ncbi:unnamed protein product [Rotaria magnacalcarata]
MHIYIDAISIETAIFSSAIISQQDDKIKAALQLGYHMQVACICQLLPTPDYNIIFKTLQENYMNEMARFIRNGQSSWKQKKL